MRRSPLPDNRRSVCSRADDGTVYAFSSYAASKGKRSGRTAARRRMHPGCTELGELDGNQSQHGTWGRGADHRYGSEHTRRGNADVDEFGGSSVLAVVGNLARGLGLSAVFERGVILVRGISRRGSCKQSRFWHNVLASQARIQATMSSDYCHRRIQELERLLNEDMQSASQTSENVRAADRIVAGFHATIRQVEELQRRLKKVSREPLPSEQTMLAKRPKRKITLE